MSSVRSIRLSLAALALALAAAAPARAQVDNLAVTPLRSALDSTQDSTPDELMPTDGAADTKTTPRPPPPGAKPPPPRKPSDLPPLKPYPRAQRNGQHGGPGEPTPNPAASPGAPTPPPGPTVAVARAAAGAPQNPGRSQSLRSRRPAGRRHRFEALRRTGRRLRQQSARRELVAQSFRPRDDRGRPRPAIAMEPRRLPRPAEGWLHRLFRDPRRQRRLWFGNRRRTG